MLGKHLKSPLQTMAYISIPFLAINLLAIAHSADPVKHDIKHLRSMSEPCSMTIKSCTLAPNTLSQSSPGNIEGRKAISTPMAIPVPIKPIKQKRDLNDSDCLPKTNFYDCDYPHFIDLSTMSVEELEIFKKEILRKEILRYEHGYAHIYIPPLCSYIPPQNPPLTVEQDTQYNQNHLFH